MLNLFQHRKHVFLFCNYKFPAAYQATIHINYPIQVKPGRLITYINLIVVPNLFQHLII